MALSKGMVRNAATTPTDARLAAAATLVKNSDGTARSGVLTPGLPALVTSRGTMSVNILAAYYVGSKSAADGAVIFGNDGTTIFTPAGWTAPLANSRTDVIWVKHNDDTTGDADALPTFGLTQGVAAATPEEPTLLPTGAIKLAAVTLPAGVTATNAGGVTIVPNYQATAMEGGIVPFRSLTELRAWAAADGEFANVAGGAIYRRSGTTWLPYIGPTWAQRTGSSSLAAGLSGTDLRTLEFNAGVTTDSNVIQLGTNAFVVQVAGWYDLEATINWATNEGSYRYVSLQKNGGSFSVPIEDRRGASGTSSSTIKGRAKLAVGDIIRLGARQEVGGLLNYQCSMTATFVSVGP